MSDPDRSSTWDANNLIHEVLGPKGGIAVLIRADEKEGFGPRAAVRKGPTDAASAAILLAQLQIGVDKILDGICAANGWKSEVMDAMVADAMAMLRPHLDSATRIQPAKDHT